MTSEKAEGPAADRTQETATTTKPAAYPYLGHESHMRLLADRIAWLEAGHTHWWIRDVRRRHAEDVAA